MKQIKLLISLWLFFITLGLGSSIDKITFITEEYPPYNYTKDGILVGKNTQIIQKIFQTTNSRQDVENIIVSPWAIGYEMALSTPNTALFSTTRTSQRENLFEWVGPLASHKTILLAKKSLPKVKANDLASLRVVVIHKDAGAQLLEEMPTKPKQIITASSNIEAAQMLHYGRVDAWAYGESTGEWILKMIGLNADDYEPILTLAKSDLYIALHPKSDKDAIKELKDALKRVQSGELVQKDAP